MYLRRSIMALACLSLLMAVGCGPAAEQGVTVKGKLLLNGQPLSIPNAPPGADQVELALYPESDSNAEAPGSVDPEGNFEFSDPKVQPGKYKMVVYLRADFDTDELKGVFSHENSPLIIDVPEANRGGELDLGTMELSDHMNK